MPEVPVFSGLLDKLKDWQDQVVYDKVIGHGLKSYRDITTLGGRIPQLSGGIDPVSNLASMIPEKEASYADFQGLQGKAWVDETYKNSPWQLMLTGAALDPMNLVGMGLPGKAAMALPAASRLQPALRAATLFDEAPGRLTGPAIDLASRGVGKAVQSTADALAPSAARFSAAHPNIAGGVNNVMSGWREQALLSPGYHVRNATENLLRPILDSGDWRTSGETLKNMLGRESRFDELSAQHGWDKDLNIQRTVNQDPTGMPNGSVFRKVDFARPSPPPAGPGVWSPPNPNLAQRTGNAVADKVASAMELNQRAGTHIEGSARKAAFSTEYDRAIAEGASHQQAIDGATDYANKLFFDYSNTGSSDELARNVFAFHKFAKGNIPAQLKAAGERPAMLNIPSNYYDVSDQYNKQHGLPSRFHGELPLGDTGWNINPMGLWSVGQLVGAATQRTQNDDEGTALGQVADTGQQLGLGLNPFIDALLTVTGQHGRSFAPGFLRASQPVNGVLSNLMGRPVDIEGGPKELLGNVQEALTGQRPFPYQEYLLRKRQAELKALGKDPSQAGSNVGRQMALEGLAGFVGIPGLKLLTPEEQAIRKNAQLAQAYKLAGNTPGYRANPTAGAYAALDPRDEQVANWDKLSAVERQRLLRDPEVRDQLLDKLAMQLHNGSQQRAANPFIGRAQGQGASRSSQTSYRPVDPRR